MTDVTRIADQLIAAAAERRALAEPFTAHEQLDVERAYEVQQAVVDGRLRAGATIVGAKLGLTSRAKQRQMQVDEPLYGWLTSDMVLLGDEPLDLSRFIHPRAEPEIAFLLREQVDAPATTATVLASTHSVFAAIEIIDSRYDAFRFGHADVIADNASSAAIVLGSRPRSPDQLGDLRLCGCVLRVDGRIVSTAAGAAALGHPATAVAWLIDQLHRRGQTLPAGSIVLSGALTDAVALAPGATVTAEFDGLGVVGVRA
jgi:2-oxo-3-hexenedioate decarboxylase